MATKQAVSYVWQLERCLAQLQGILWLAISGAMQGSDLYMNAAPYPPYGPTREHALVLPAEHIAARNTTFRDFNLLSQTPFPILSSLLHVLFWR